MTVEVWFFLSLLVAGYLTVGVGIVQLHRVWTGCWLPFGIGEWRVPSFSLSLRWVEVEA